ncbi:MAG: hypothetical protein ACXWC8_14875, partial [Limisphaerales bacterium]
MTARLLSFSLCLNLVLLGAVGYRFGTSHRVVSSPTAADPIAPTNRLSQTNVEAPSAATAPLRWSDLESENYPTYVANLRRAGCPDPALRQIISADLKELYAQKAFASVKEFHRDFWEIAARENVRAYFEKTLRPQIKVLCQESDALLKQLLGEAPAEAAPTPTVHAIDSRWTDFLSPAKQEQLRQSTERYNALLHGVSESALSPEEKASQQAQLRRDM